MYGVHVTDRYDQLSSECQERLFAAMESVDGCPIVRLCLSVRNEEGAVEQIRHSCPPTHCGIDPTALQRGHSDTSTMKEVLQRLPSCEIEYPL